MDDPVLEYYRKRAYDLEYEAVLWNKRCLELEQLLAEMKSDEDSD